MRIFYLTILVIALPISTSKTCRGLALSGGGTLGGYEAGVLSSLFNYTQTQGAKITSDDLNWDVVTGVSIGSMTATVLSFTPHGKEIENINLLLSIYLGIKESDVLKQWPGGYLQGFLEPAMFNSTVWRTTLNDHVYSFYDGNQYRKLSIGSDNLNTGWQTIFTEENYMTSVPLTVDGIMCSSAFPFVFLPQQCVHRMIDGGTDLNLLVNEAIARCSEIADTESDIIIDIISCTNYDTPQAAYSKVKYWKTNDYINLLMKYQSIQAGVKEIEYAEIDHPDVNFRFNIGPSKDIGSMIDFSKSSIENMIAVGKKDAIDAVNKLA